MLVPSKSIVDVGGFELVTLSSCRNILLTILTVFITILFNLLRSPNAMNFLEVVFEIIRLDERGNA